MNGDRDEKLQAFIFTYTTWVQSRDEFKTHDERERLYQIYCQARDAYLNLNDYNFINVRGEL